MEKKKSQGQSTKKSNKNLVLLGLGTAATLVLSYFGWNYWKNNHSTNSTTDNANDIPDSNPTSYAHKAKAKPSTMETANIFPLKKGSRGDKVKALQQALINSYGAGILPKYGADGDFGSELSTALKTKGLPDSIDESTFNVIVKGSSPDPAQTALQLYLAAIRKDYNKVVTLLKTLHNTGDYKAVSDVFTNNYRINGVRQTLVNGILNSFADASQKQAIRFAFTSMGLKYDGSKWSLAGLEEHLTIITNRPSKVWKDPKHFVEVPPNMVLGKEVSKRKNFTLFENGNQYFLIASEDVNYYNN
jgi:peptidoglycan hydrolase-like protein with peptidoglycan-binding domain